MIYRFSNNWNLWGNAHPSGHCKCEGHGCNCRYHIVKMDNSKVYGFNNFQDADAKFVELTNGQSLKDSIINKI